MKALEKNRKLRFQTASDLRVDLQRLKRDFDSGLLGPPPAPSTVSRSNSEPAPNEILAETRVRRFGDRGIDHPRDGASQSTFRRRRPLLPPPATVPPAPAVAGDTDYRQLTAARGLTPARVRSLQHQPAPREAALACPAPSIPASVVEAGTTSMQSFASRERRRTPGFMRRRSRPSAIFSSGTPAPARRSTRTS